MMRVRRRYTFARRMPFATYAAAPRSARCCVYARMPDTLMPPRLIATYFDAADAVADACRDFRRHTRAC